jgi:hypothetical protein
VNRVQNELVVLQAEVSSIGSTLWNQVQQDLAQAVADGQTGGPSHFPDYSFTMSDLLDQQKAVIVTKESGWLVESIKGRIPTDEEIATAENRVVLYRRAVEFAKSVLPEISPVVNADAAQVRASVEATPLRSPGEVGEKAFYEILKERARGLGDISLWLAAAALLLGVAYLAGGRR